MSTYRVGRSWGVTIVREGERTPEGHIVGADQLVAVVTNGDLALAERICALLNGETSARRVLMDLVDPDPCQFDHHGYCQAHGWLEDGKCPHYRAKELL